MRAYLLSALLLVAGCGCAGITASVAPAHEAVRATTHRIKVRVPDGMMGCSATAIAADRLLTATHCVAGMTELYVDDEGVEVAGVKVRGDRATVTLAEPAFTVWAQLGPRPKQGDRVRWWGNPRGIQNIYRESIIAAVVPGQVVVEAMVCPGDSGSGIFNEAGQVVAVMSEMGPDYKGVPCVFGIGQL